LKKKFPIDIKNIEKFAKLIKKFKIFIRSRFKSVDMVIEGDLIDQISGFTV